jgi:hypothetical protein
VSIIRTTSLFAVLLGWLVQLPTLAADDQAIVIDEDLAASVDVLPVSVAAQKTFKVADFRFGEYVVVSSKLGMAKGHTIEWINPLQHDENEQKFSFVMKGVGAETARVTAVQRFESGPLKRYGVVADRWHARDRDPQRVVADAGRQRAGDASPRLRIPRW